MDVDAWRCRQLPAHELAHQVVIVAVSMTCLVNSQLINSGLMPGIRIGEIFRHETMPFVYDSPILDDNAAGVGRGGGAVEAVGFLRGEG